MLYMETHSLKIPRSNLTRTRIRWSQTPFRVNYNLEISQLDVEYDPELSQYDPVISHVCLKLTDFQVIFDPEWSLATTDPPSKV